MTQWFDIRCPTLRILAYALQDSAFPRLQGCVVLAVIDTPSKEKAMQRGAYAARAGIPLPQSLRSHGLLNVNSEAYDELRSFVNASQESATVVANVFEHLVKTTCSVHEDEESLHALTVVLATECARLRKRLDALESPGGDA